MNTQHTPKRKRKLHHKIQYLFVGNVRMKTVQVTINVNITKNNAENSKKLDIPLNYISAKK